MKVVITEDLWVPLPEDFRARHRVIYDPALFRDPARLAAHLAEAEALVVRNRTRVTGELLAAAPRLRLVGRLGVGLDNLDLAACRARGVTVVAARGMNATSVAEYVMAALFEHARRLSAASARTRAGEWNRQACTGRELAGRTLGLIGVGDIGGRVAIRARAIGMRVIAHDPFLLPSGMLTQDFGVALTSLEEVCREADYVSLHAPLTAQTRHLVGARALGWMKQTAVLINTARGGLVDERALADWLTASPDRFAVLDVREVEPPAPDDPLARLPNVLLTPHIAGVTEESAHRVATFILDQVDRASRGEPVQGVVI
ncbi:hydroxyacid dehydrogenase [Alicyclobacillus sp.]|uniref:hydroxyacid dehydrogenase n=1 Tax=Alicyclobacillus sp. TaxID=61169 RepID=UPI0025C67541|nr:hydroxyacid dehydrogenase [Alicyclobacillus sp.]MCL6517194.1 hydroxyacid dehydrogenase [Alicyclobacillus sp.]